MSPRHDDVRCRRPARFAPIRWGLSGAPAALSLGTLERQAKLALWVCIGLQVMLAVRLIVLGLAGRSETILPIVLLVPTLVLAGNQQQTLRHLKKLSEGEPREAQRAPEGTG
jgi:hypothetical protein